MVLQVNEESARTSRGWQGNCGVHAYHVSAMTRHLLCHHRGQNINCKRRRDLNNISKVQIKGGPSLVSTGLGQPLLSSCSESGD